LTPWSDVALDDSSEGLSTISQEEASCLYDLLCKVWVYDLTQRWSAEQLLSHPWFYL
jgi:serine/threonine-protein kinase SRPK3